MRAYSPLFGLNVPAPADTVQIMLLAGGTAQAMDWANSTVGSSDVHAEIVRFSAVTTAGASLNFHVNLATTEAALPSSGTSVSSGIPPRNTYHCSVERTLQIPRGSTGWSAIARTSGYIIAEVWRQ